MTTDTAEIVLALQDLQTSVGVGFAEVALRQDVSIGAVHFVAAGLAVLVVVSTWIAVMSTRR